MADVEIDCNPNTGTLTMKLNLKAQNGQLMAYGALEFAKEQVSRYFVMMQVKQRQEQERLGILKPMAPPTPMGVA